MILSLCMIARDNERTIRRCLESVRPWVDEMVVVDTGSQDDTPQVARDCGATVSEFPWCDDFSAARNASFDRARGEWLFWMDTDDYLPPECGQRLRHYAEGPHRSDLLGYCVQVHCPGNVEGDLTIVDHVKLVRNHPAIRFEFRIHEQLLPSIRRLGGDVAQSDLHVVHEGALQTPETRALKRDRDLRILALEVEERPDHPFALFNLGMTHADLGEHESACRFLERCLAVSDLRESQVPKAIALLVGSLAALDRPMDAERVCRRGLEHFADDLELRFRHAILLNDLGRTDEAIRAYREVIAIPNQQRFRSVDPGIGSYKAMFNLAMLLRHHGDLAATEALLREAIAANPLWTPAHEKLVEVLVEAGRLAAAEIAHESLSRTKPPREVLILSSARRFEAQGHIDHAREMLLAVAESSVLEADAVEYVARFLFDHGPDEAAVRVLERVAQRRPCDGAAWHNLGAVQARSGAIDDARVALSKSLAVRPDSEATRRLLKQLTEDLVPIGFDDDRREERP